LVHHIAKATQVNTVNSALILSETDAILWKAGLFKIICNCKPIYDIICKELTSDIDYASCLKAIYDGYFPQTCKETAYHPDTRQGIYFHLFLVHYKIIARSLQDHYKIVVIYIDQVIACV
jgi:hypothetical protein